MQNAKACNLDQCQILKFPPTQLNNYVYSFQMCIISQGTKFIIKYVVINIKDATKDIRQAATITL